MAASNTINVVVGGVAVSAPADTLAAPEVTKAPDVDCVGSWLPCSAGCTQVYWVAVQQSNAGLPCAEEHNALARCSVCPDTAGTAPSPPAGMTGLSASADVGLRVSAVEPGGDGGGAGVGIIIGVGLGMLLIGGAAGAFMMRRKVSVLHCAPAF